ncbi:hypothetical protein [Nocardia sp. CC227C]|uniref:hypothetical protein n=1 Tax=Nocardia sp. CC227C TaxID=3044562 RepID=UPI00278BF1EA|nr:hypothetical protein [Nocardia sp. CC227C]
MATWPPYKAGSAYLALKPRLPATFKTDVRTLLAPIKESLKVTATPTLERGFKTNLKQAVKTASEGVGVKVPVEPNTRGFKTALKTDVRTAAEGVTVKVPVEAKIRGLRTDLRSKVKTAATGITVTVPVSPDLAAGFKTTLTTAVDAVLAEVNPHIEFRPGLRQGFTADLKLALGGVLSKVRSQTAIEFRPTLARGFRNDLRTKLTTSTGGIKPKVPVDVDLTAATEQLTAWRAAQHAIPLTLNVNVDAAAATAQLLALRSLVGSLNGDLDRAGRGFGGLGGGSGSRRRGNIFTRPYYRIRLQVQLDRESLARAEADLAQSQQRAQQARRREEDASNRRTLAQLRFDEVMARANASVAQRTAATQALTRAHRDYADAVERASRADTEANNARRRRDESRANQGGFRRLFRAGLAGFGSALGDSIRNLASNMLSFSNIVNVALVGLLALAAVSLVPLIGQLVQAAGVVALLPAALAGAVSVFATVKFAVGGIGDAFSAASKASEQSGQQMEQKAKAVASAQKQAAAAAKSVVQAERGIVTAERGVRDAQQDSLDAQKDLTKARKSAARSIDEMNRSLRRSRLDEEGAALSVAEAYKTLHEVFADPDADGIDRARAQHNLKQALVDQEDTIARTKQLAEDTAETNAKGIEGADEVVSAQERITAAAEAEADAQQALVDAHATLADAQANLVEAQQAVFEAMNDSGSAANEFEKALGKLSPSAQDFVSKILALKPAWEDFKQSVQEQFFRGLGDDISRLTNNSLPTLETGLSRIAVAINKSLRGALADLDTDATRTKLARIFHNVEMSIDGIIRGLSDILQGMLSLAGVGSDFFPGMSDGFADMARRFREWAESPEGQNSFREYLRDSLETLGNVIELLKQIGRVIGAIFKGSDSLGEDWLSDITDSAKRLADHLNTPEGQQGVKDFFTDVKDAAEAVIKAVKWTIKLLDRLEGYGKRFDESPLGGLLGLTDDEKSGGDKITGLGKGLLGASPIAQVGKWSWDNFGKPQWDAYSGWVTDAMEGIGQSLAEKVPGIVSWMAQARNSFSDFASSASESLTTGVGGALTGLAQNVPGVSSAIELFQKDSGTALETFKAGATSVFDFLTSSEGFSRLSTSFGGVVGAITGEGGLGKLRSAFDSLPGYFKGIVGGIGANWGELGSKLAGPINTVIDLLNSGIGSIWNKIDDLLGLGKPWTDIQKISTSVGQRTDLGTKPLQRAMGGPIHGPGGPTADKVPAWLSNGEHVWTAAEVEAAGGHQAMQQMRRAVLTRGGQQSPDANFAIGGGVQFGSDIDRWMASAIQGAFDNATITSAYRPGHSGFHGKGQAVDIVGPYQQIADYIFSAYPQSAQLIWGPGPLLYNVGGTAIDPANQAALRGVYAGDLAGHYDHVHWAANAIMGNLSDEDRKSLFDRIRSGIGGVASGGRGIAADLIARPLRALVDKVPTLDGFGAFGAVPRALAGKVVEAIISKIRGAAGASSGTADFNPSAGAEQWRQMMIDAYRNQGYEPTPEKIDAWVRQIDTESGGDPDIAQQIVDVNGTGESAGVGLGQMIPSTWQAYRDPSLPDDRRDPWAMTNAMVRYGEQKYGDRLLDVIGRGHGYDQGGIWPHGTAGWNLSGLPEAVLTNPQWQLLRQLAQQLGFMPQEVQPLPQQTDTGTDPSFTMPNVGQQTPHDAGVDTPESLWSKTQDRFKNVWETGLNDLIDSNLGALGIPDPRDIPAVTAVQGYASDLDTWAKAKAATAQATQAAQQATIQAQTAGTPVTASNVITSDGTGNLTSNNDTMIVNIYPADQQDAYRKMQQIADLRSLTKTARK